MISYSLVYQCASKVDQIEIFIRLLYTDVTCPRTGRQTEFFILL